MAKNKDKNTGGRPINEQDPNKTLMAGGNKGKSEAEEEELDLLEYIIGSFAQMIAGVKNVDQKKIKNAVISVDPSKTIFGNVKSIAENVKTLKDNNSNLNTALTNINACISEDTKSINVKLTGFSESIKDSITEAITTGITNAFVNDNGKSKVDVTNNSSAKLDIDFNTGDLKTDNVDAAIKSILALNTFFENMGYYDKDDGEKLKGSLKNIELLIKGVKDDNKNGSIQGVITALNGITTDNLNVQTASILSAVFSITKDLSTIIGNIQNIDVEKSKPSFKALISLFDSSSKISFQALVDSIKKVLPSVAELTDINKSKEGLNILNSFISLLTSIVSVSPLKILKGKLSLMLINTLIIDSIINLVHKFENVVFDNLNSEELEDAFDIFNSFIDSVIKLGELSPENRDAMEENLYYIETFIEKRMLKMVKNIVKSVTSSEEDIKKSKEAFKTLFEVIDEVIKFKDYNDSDFDKITDNFFSLKDIIDFDLKETLKSFNNIFVIQDSVKEISIRGHVIRQGKDKQTINPDTIINTLKNTHEIFDEVNNLLSSLKDTKHYLLASLKFYFINNEIDKIKTIIFTLSQKNFYDQTLKRIVTKVLPRILEITKAINEINDSLKKFDPSLFKQLDSVLTLIDKISLLDKLEKLNKISSKGIDALKGNINGLIDAIKLFDKIKKSELNKAKEVVNMTIKIVVSSAAILIFAGLTMRYIKVKDLLGFTASLSFLLFSLTFVFKTLRKPLELSLPSAKAASLLVISSGLILILAGLVMKNIDISNLLGFTVVLSVFLASILFIFKRLNIQLKIGLQGAKNAAILIGASAFILLFGSMFYQYLDIESLFGFSLVLMTFVGGILLFFGAASFMAKHALRGLSEVSSVIFASAFVLIFGSMIWPYIDKKSLVEFSLTLMVFVGGILIFYGIASSMARGSLKGAKEMGKLILFSALILIFGSMIWPYIDKKALLQFALTLMGFVGGILLFYGFAGRLSRGAMKHAGKITLLIVVSAAILVFGSMLISKKIISPLALVEFGVIFTAFIFGIIFVIKRASKGLEHSLKSIIGLSLITLVAGGILLAAGYIIAKNPHMAWAIPLFAAILVGYMYGMAKVADIIGDPKKTSQMKQGLITMAAITGITAGMVLVINMLSKTASNEGFLLNILKGVGAMFLVFGAVTAGIIGLGALYSSPAGVFIQAGAILLGIVEGLVLLASIAINTLAKAMQEINKVEKMDPKMFINNIKGFVEIIGEMKPIADNVWMITKASFAIGRLDSALSKIARAMKSWADLKIPIYEGTKIVGYETITSAAFPQAAKNIKTVVTTLAQAIVDAYNENPKLFEMDFSVIGLIAGGTVSPFMKVVKSLKAMGPMLSSIAKGIKEWASLKIPEYTGTKITGYITIVDQDFMNAAKNIKTVIKTLAQAIVDAYNENPDLFAMGGGILGTGLGANSPFMKVVKSLKTMGPMLSSIAKGVKDWADLKIPIYNGEKIVKYETLTSKEFVKAGDNIKEVVTTLAQAIVDAYNENPDLFKIDLSVIGLISGGTVSPFMKVVKSIGTLGPMLSRIGDALKLWADLKIPKYKENSTEIETYVTLTSQDFANVGTNINSVVTILSESIYKAYENNKKMFDNDWFTDSPFTKVCKSIGRMGPMLKDIADAIQMWADLKIPIYKKGSTEIESYESLTSEHFAAVGANISLVVGCLGDAIVNLYNEKEYMFDDGWFTDSPFAKVVKSIEPMGRMLKDIADAIQMWADLKIPIYKPGTTEIETYAQLNKTDMKNAAENIGVVVSTLANAIIKIYDDNKDTEMFEAAAWHGFGDSKFAKVSKSLAPMGEMLKNCAQAVIDWSSLQIPVYDKNGAVDANGNPKIEKYLNISDNDFYNVGLNIGKTVSVLAFSVAALYNKNPDLFNSDGWLGLGDTPIAKVAKSLKPMGDMLGSIAEGIKFWADLKIPKYEGTKIVKYISLGEDEFKKVGENIAAVVTCLGQSLIDVVSGNEQIFEGDIAKNAAASINKVSNTLVSIATVLANYVSGNFTPGYYDKEGNWKSTGKPVHFDPDKDGPELKKRIRTILVSLGESVLEVYEEAQAKGIDFTDFTSVSWDNWEDWGQRKGTYQHARSPIVIMAESIFNIAHSLKTMVDVLNGLQELKTEGIVDFIGDKNKGLVQTLSLIMNGMFSLGCIMGSQEFDPTFWRGDGTAHLKDNTEAFKTLDSWAGTSKNVSGRVLNDLKTSIEAIFNKIEDINKIYNENKNNIDQFTKKDGEENLIAKSLKDVLNTFFSIGHVFYALANDESKNYIFKSIKLGNAEITVSDATAKLVQNIQTNASSIFRHINTLNKDFKSNNVNIDVKGMIKTFSDIKTVIDEFDQIFINNAQLNDVNKQQDINSLFNFKDRLKNKLDKYLSSDEIKEKIDLIKSVSNDMLGLAQQNKTQYDFSIYGDLAKGLTTVWNAIEVINDKNIKVGHIEHINDALYKIIGTVKLTPSIDLFKILARGIIYIYTATKEILSVTNFQKHTEWLQKYVKAINDIQINKLISLIRLIDAITALKETAGDLDKLTEAISDKLSTVLQELVKQLKHADESIKNAHKLQETRKKLIEESLNKVTNIMGQHMIVEISQTGAGSTTPSDEGGSDIEEGHSSNIVTDVLKKTGEIISHGADNNQSFNQEDVTEIDNMFSNYNNNMNKIKELFGQIKSSARDYNDNRWKTTIDAISTK